MGSAAGDPLACGGRGRSRQRAPSSFNGSQQVLGPLDMLVNAAGVNIPNRSMASDAARAMGPDAGDQCHGCLQLPVLCASADAGPQRRAGHQRVVGRRQACRGTGRHRLLCLQVRHDGPGHQRGQRVCRRRRADHEYLSGRSEHAHAGKPPGAGVGRAEGGHGPTGRLRRAGGGHRLPAPRAHVAEIVLKPTVQEFC